MRPTFIATLAIGLTGCSENPPTPASGDPRTGDMLAAGDLNGADGGDKAAGDPAGDTTAGDPAGDTAAGDPAGDTSAGDPAGDNVGGDPAPRCITNTTSTAPWALDLPHDGDNGVFDASLDADPISGRLWMSYSSVNGPAGTGYVSTYLGYSDDGGATWCLAGLVNEATDVPVSDRPTEFASFPSHWNHEVSALAHDPGAPASQRWVLIWHRYLEALDTDPGTDDRRFTYGWIAAKRAATPEGLLLAAEDKLFATPGYYVNTAVTDYNDAIIGPPEKSWVGDANVGQCAFFTEPGMMSWNGQLYVSMMCAVAEADVSAVLLRLNRGGPTPVWESVGSIMTQAESQATIDATVGPGVVTMKGVSATALFSVAGVPTVSLTPVVDAYRGCWFFDIDLTDASITSTPPAIPTGVIPNTPASIFSGMCEYDDAATVSGVIFGEVYPSGVQFRLFGTEITP